MNRCGPLLLGLLALALRAGTAAAEPAPPSVTPAPAVEAPLVTVEDGEGPEGGRGEWVPGAGLYLGHPYFQNNPAYNVLQENNGVSPRLIRADRVDIRHRVGAAPLVWLGYMGEDGVGGRARFWHFRQGTAQTVSAPPFDGVFDPDT